MSATATPPGGWLAVLAAAVAIKVSVCQSVLFQHRPVAERQRVVAGGTDVFPEHVAVGHLTDHGVDALIRENRLDRRVKRLASFLDELLELG